MTLPLPCRACGAPSITRAKLILSEGAVVETKSRTIEIPICRECSDSEDLDKWFGPLLTTAVRRFRGKAEKVTTASVVA